MTLAYNKLQHREQCRLKGAELFPGLPDSIMSQLKVLPFKKDKLSVRVEVGHPSIIKKMRVTETKTQLSDYNFISHEV